MPAKSLNISVAVVIACVAMAAVTACTSRQTEGAKTVYVAELHPMNTGVTGQRATGEARFTVQNDTLTIDITMKGVPPGVEHWQHFHGFKNDSTAGCPTAKADVNHDGIIDLIETEATSGTTMVPFNGDPAAMQVASNTYPIASDSGTYVYKKKVLLDTLKSAFNKAFGTSNLDLDHRVVFIHGVSADSALPPSVASLGTIPAHVTLPIACGKIEQAANP